MGLILPFSGIFRNTRVLVTGHTGFKGAWLSIWLNQLGAHVFGYSLPAPTEPSLFELARVEECLEGHTVADVRDLDSFGAAVDAAQPEVIFHCAAQALVRQSYYDPVATFQTNIFGTMNLLEAVRKRNQAVAVVVVTSDKCYENTGQLQGFREFDPMGGCDPYSASKGAAELVVAGYRRSFFPDSTGIRVATVRAGNVIGGGDWADDRIVPDAIRALMQNQPVSVRNPQSVRPWQHVLEPLAGYLNVAGHLMKEDGPAFCKGWNFGPIDGDTVAVKVLVENMIRHWGEGTWEDVSDPDQLAEAPRLRLNIEQALRTLDWYPRWDINTALARTIRWYRAVADDCDARTLCEEDIDLWCNSQSELGVQA